jgi:AraC-like DNA-binding protein
MLVSKYADAPDSRWLHKSKKPLILKLLPAMLSELSLSANILLNSDKSKMLLDWFLLDLFRILQPLFHKDIDESVPGWLQHALIEIHDKDNFRQGATALAHLSNRSAEHVSRITKRLLKQTPSEIVNQARLKYAAREILQSDDNILTIAIDCGFHSLSQFYKLFKSSYGVTPRQYRLNTYHIN